MEDHSTVTSVPPARSRPAVLLSTGWLAIMMRRIGEIPRPRHIVSENHNPLRQPDREDRPCGLVPCRCLGGNPVPFKAQPGQAGVIGDSERGSVQPSPGRSMRQRHGRA